MSNEGEMATQESDPASNLRRRKLVECAQEKIEQGNSFVSLNYLDKNTCYSLGATKEENPVCRPLPGPKTPLVEADFDAELRCCCCFPARRRGCGSVVVAVEVETVPWPYSTCKTPCFHSKQCVLPHSTVFNVNANKLFKQISQFLSYSLLKAAEEYHLPKILKESKGGGLKEFLVQDFQSYEGSEDEEHFFTTEERQWLVLRLLESIRAKVSDTEAVSGLTLLEGQPIGT